MKFVVWKSTGGLFHMLGGLTYSIQFCKDTNRKLIVDSRGGSFRKNFDDFFNIVGIEYSTNYEDILNKNDLKIMGGATLDQVINSNACLRKNVYYIFDSDKSNGVPISRGLDKNSNENILMYAGPSRSRIKDVSECIKVNKDIVEWIQTKKIDTPYIGVHYRNTDKKTSIEKIIEKIKKLIEIYKIYTIYLATDDYLAKSKFENYLSNVEIVSYANIPQIKTNNVHRMDDKKLEKCNITKDEIIKDSLLDVYMLIESTYFVESAGSGFTEYVNCAREEKESIFSIVV